MDRSVGRLLGWKQSVQTGMASKALGNETFHKSGDKLETGLYEVQCLRRGVT